ncbi:histidine acid phosphatase [Oesophagostomum dentatum]|uniref:acid phosphatase n=1 Tax=Oesophagostomum dentatum TaxID=61180 RepID=A0A0B1T4X2_OESDE|nr:histidine acid phosphatase [Oesophagostomum dentatum]
MLAALLALLTPSAIALSDGKMNLLLVHVKKRITTFVGIDRYGGMVIVRLQELFRMIQYKKISGNLEEEDSGNFRREKYNTGLLGMKQHFNLGKKIRKLYVDTGFLGKRYSSAEIYVRSTDYNRTIISALSNMIGMYGWNHGASRKGLDYPDVEGWPEAYVPIAVHTIDRRKDYEISSPGCPRRNKLQEIALESEEAKALLKSPKVVNLFKELTLRCGEEVDANNFWRIRDILFIEQIHANEILRKENEWFSDSLFNEMTYVDLRISRLLHGTFERPVVVNELDIGREIQKVRGGTLFNKISTQMDMKLDCLNNTHKPKCKWINGLKYFVFSAHDFTLNNFFSILNLTNSEVVLPDGYPGYAAAAFIELWVNSTDNRPYFKVR